MSCLETWAFLFVEGLCLGLMSRLVLEEMQKALSSKPETSGPYDCLSV